MSSALARAAAQAKAKAAATVTKKAPASSQPRARRNIKNHIDLSVVRVILSKNVKKIKHEWVEHMPDGSNRKMLPDDIIDICPSCVDGPIRWSDVRSKRKAGPTSTLLTCNRQAQGRCDYSGAKNRSTRRQMANAAGKASKTNAKKRAAGGAGIKSQKVANKQKPSKKTATGSTEQPSRKRKAPRSGKPEK